VGTIGIKYFFVIFIFAFLAAIVFWLNTWGPVCHETSDQCAPSKYDINAEAEVINQVGVTRG
jgi:hypothetical protein